MSTNYTKGHAVRVDGESGYIYDRVTRPGNYHDVVCQNGEFWNVEEDRIAPEFPQLPHEMSLGEINYRATNWNDNCRHIPASRLLDFAKGAEAVRNAILGEQAPKYYVTADRKPTEKDADAFGDVMRWRELGNSGAWEAINWKMLASHPHNGQFWMTNPPAPDMPEPSEKEKMTRAFNSWWARNDVDESLDAESAKVAWMAALEYAKSQK